jgi:hypothetical protein
MVNQSLLQLIRASMHACIINLKLSVHSPPKNSSLVPLRNNVCYASTLPYKSDVPKVVESSWEWLTGAGRKLKSLTSRPLRRTKNYIVPKSRKSVKSENEAKLPESSWKWYSDQGRQLNPLEKRLYRRPLHYIWTLIVIQSNI